MPDSALSEREHRECVDIQRKRENKERMNVGPPFSMPAIAAGILYRKDIHMLACRPNENEISDGFEMARGSEWRATSYHKC